MNSRVASDLIHPKKDEQNTRSVQQIDKNKQFQQLKKMFLKDDLINKKKFPYIMRHQSESNSAAQARYLSLERQKENQSLKCLKQQKTATVKCGFSFQKSLWKIPIEINLSLTKVRLRVNQTRDSSSIKSKNEDKLKRTKFFKACGIRVQ